MVVVRSPAFDDGARPGQASEPMQVQAVFPELAIEAFHEGVPCRLSGLDKVQSHTGLPGPEEHGPGSEPRTIVQHQGPGQWPGLAELIGMPGQAGARVRRVDELADTLAGEVIDEVEDPEPPAIGELIGHEVRRPALAGLRRHRHRHPGPRDLPAALGSHLQAFLALGPVGALAVDDASLPVEHLVQRQIAVAGIALGQDLQPTPQLRVVTALLTRASSELYRLAADSCVYFGGLPKGRWKNQLEPMKISHITKYLCVFISICSSIHASAQSSRPPVVLAAETNEGPVLVLSDEAVSAGEVAVLPDTRVSVSIEGQYRVYRARHKGKDTKVHVSLDNPQRRIAFDPAQGRFRDILPSLRVEMDNFARFEDLVEQAGGTGGKVYEALGFALILLPDATNPAEVAAELKDLPGVTRATIQLQGPLYVPM